MPRQPNYLKNYYAKNRERIRAYHKEHHAENRDTINADKRAYRSAHPEPGGSYGLAYQRDYKTKNRDSINAAQRAYRKANPEMYKRYNAARNKKECLRRLAFKAMTNSYKAERGCIDCGIKNPVVLDFDHVGPKLFDIANGSARNPAKVSAEMAKCEIRCSNCHRIKTHQRRADIKMCF